MLKKNKMEKFKVKVGDEWVPGIGVSNLGIDWISTTGCRENAKKTWIEGDVANVREIAKNTHPGAIVEFIPVPTEKQPEPKPKELDLCEILKDAPRGLKLWSTIYGEVCVDEINSPSAKYPIGVISNKNECFSVTQEGLYFADKDGECTLFPSKDNRDWSTFKLPYKLPVKGELCWTMSSVGNWVLRFATGKIGEISGLPLFFACQNQKFGDPFPYQWQPLSEIPEVLKSHLKLK